MKKLLWVLSAIVITTFVIIACQKEASSPKNIFDQQAAKEWYYGNFKKTAGWAAYNAVTNGKKLPDWKNGQYKKAGGIEIVEFPLIKEKRSVTITFRGQLAEGDRKKIADAVVSRVVFIKNTAGKISVRELQYVPDMNYLAAHHFDISNNRFGSFDKDFSGTVVTKKWNGQEVSRNILKNGKVTARFKSPLNSNHQRTESCPSGSTEVTEWARDDEMHIYGDGLITYEYGEWYPTGMTWCVGEESIEENGGCNDPGSTDCFCELIGGCEEEGGGGENPNQCSMSCEDAHALIEGITTEELSEVTNEDGVAVSPDPYGIIRKPVTRIWPFLKIHFAGSYYVEFSAFFNGIVYKANENDPWKWESLTYSHTQKTAGTTPPCFSVSCTASVSGPIIAADGLHAYASLSYSATATVPCFFNMEAGSYSDTINGQTFLPG